MNLFKKPNPPPPAKVPTDTVVPFRFWDNSSVLRMICMDFTFCFEDVLDASKLKNALERLLEIGEWRQLGARVRMRVCLQ